MTTTYLIARSPDNTYGVYAVDPTAGADAIQPVCTGVQGLPYDGEVVAVGSYVLLTTGLRFVPLGSVDVYYQLTRFDPTSPTPLGGPPINRGLWPYEKFWDYYEYRDCPDSPQTLDLQLLGTPGYVLSWLPTTNRGTFSLWSFDADSTKPTADPLVDRVFDQDAHPVLRSTDALVPLNNAVLTWRPTDGSYQVFSFDPQSSNPMPMPALAAGTFTDIDDTHQLIAVGPYVLDWVPTTGAFRLFAVDTESGGSPLSALLASGTMPSGITAETRLTGLETPVPVDATRAATPGTMDFMRSKVKHVVYYVLESRSYDNVLGWLYENGGPDTWIDAEPPVRGAFTGNTNTSCGQTVGQYEFQGGGLSTDYDLNAPAVDPFHGTTDSICQQWSGGYAAYQAGEPADMGGFLANQGTKSTMVTFTPAQMPILNGLAAAFAVCDDWFCSLPGGTTANRAYLASGSAYGITVSYESGPAYTNFPDRVRRPSMFKVLANNGIDDWAVYWTIQWQGFPYTWHLFVENQVPTIDANQATHSRAFTQFASDCANGTLPAFSFIEPKWFSSDGVFSSYHPSGDIIPGQEQLNAIYETLKNSPIWEETVLVIAFSKGGGIYDHIPTPFASRAWPHDTNDGFAFDAYGSRVPAIVVSPWVKAATLFRSPTPIPFDHTSLVATVLDWFGVPRSRWGLGNRVANAPTFEKVLQASAPRTDAPTLTVAYDKTYPPT